MKKNDNTKTSKKRENLLLVRNLAIVFAFIAIVVGVVALPSSAAFQRIVPAVTVGDVTLSAKEFGEYYTNTYNWYKLKLTDKLGDASTFPAFEDLADTVRDEGTDETYAEYFRELTIEKITEFYALSGTQITPEMVYQTDEYTEIKKASLEITDEQITAYMAENTDLCDKFTYRYITLKTDSGDDASLESLRTLAKGIPGRVTSETDFIAEARAYDMEKYAEDKATLSAINGDLMNPYYRDFLRDSSRKAGDTYVVDMPTGAYVVYFVSREQDREKAETMLRDKMFGEWLTEVKPAAKIRWGIKFSY